MLQPFELVSQLMLIQFNPFSLWILYSFINKIIFHPVSVDYYLNVVTFHKINKTDRIGDHNWQKPMSGWSETTKIQNEMVKIDRTQCCDDVWIVEIHRILFEKIEIVKKPVLCWCKLKRVNQDAYNPQESVSSWIKLTKAYVRINFPDKNLGLMVYLVGTNVKIISIDKNLC